MAIALWHSRALDAKASFYYWLSFGFGCFAVGISWVHVSMDTFGGMPLIASVGLMALLALYLALYPALTGLALAWLTKTLSKNGETTFSLWRNLALFPALWTMTEWARGWVMTGFPWLWAGYSQTQGPLKPLASIIGALGLSFVLAMLAGALALFLLSVIRVYCFYCRSVFWPFGLHLSFGTFILQVKMLKWHWCKAIFHKA